jgi:indolepyruvate ferredoxin oxidoreductase
MPDVLQAHDITFVPGLNEELAATSVWGSQADLPMGTPTHDGVVGVWYGKGPGLDRATDALRHANMYGANPRGGMLLLVGDDPASKSSTVPAVSERSLAALGFPVPVPAQCPRDRDDGHARHCDVSGVGLRCGAEDRRRCGRRRMVGGCP